jgi:RNase P subunit RPR2
MELSFLKKHTRSHRFLCVLSKSEVNAILDKYVPQLRSIQTLNVREYPEVQDEYYEKMDSIVNKAREDLKEDTRSKMNKNIKDPFIIKYAVLEVAGLDVKNLADKD